MIPRFNPPVGVGDVLGAMLPGSGDDIAAFERVFAGAVGQRYAVAFPYGRTALMGLLQALDLHDRDVLCPAYTCVVVPNAVVFSGNRPVFIDSQADANADLLRAAGQVTPRTGALIATSIFGHPVNLDDLAAFRKAHPDVVIIQDCAHSFLCEWQQRPVHIEGAAAIFGLNISKTMTSVFGGMVTTDDRDLAARVARQRDAMLLPAGWQKQLLRCVYALAALTAFWPPLFGLTARLRDAGLLDRFTRYFSDDLIEMPSDYLAAMTPFEARVGQRTAPRLPALIAARRAYDAHYRRELADIPALSWVPRGEGSSVSHSAARVADKDNVRKAAATLGVELGEVIEYSVPDMAAYQPYLAGAGPFPVSALLARTTINLPTCTTFDPAIADKVVRVMRQVLAGQSPAPPLPV